MVIKLTKIFLQTIKDFTKDNGPQWAASIAYYSLLSIFPLLLAGISLLTFIANPDWAVVQLTAQVGYFVPVDISQVQSLISSIIKSRGTASLVSIVLLLWSGTGVFTSIRTALNIAYGGNKGFAIFKDTLYKFMMLAGIAVLFLISYFSQYILGFIVKEAGLILPEIQFLFSALLSSTSDLLLLGTFFLLYRFVPRSNVTWQAAFGGAFFSTILYIVARSLFGVYIHQFAQYNLVYGSLAIGIIIIFWAWLASAILILGGELTSNIQLFFFKQNTGGHYAA